MTNDPSSIARSTPCRARTSLGVSALKVLTNAADLEHHAAALLRPKLARHVRQDQRRKDEAGGNELQIVRIQPAAERDRDEQPEQHGSHDGAGDDESELADADERLADDDAGQSPHHHADSHLHVSESLVLGEERTGGGNQSVRECETQHDHRVHVDAERPDHLVVVTGGLHGGAEIGPEEEVERRGDHDRDQQREQQDRHVTCTLTSHPSTLSTGTPSRRVPHVSAMLATVRSDMSGTLLLPMT